MAFIPEDKLLEIKDAARIEEVVGQYVQLQQRGKNLLGLCPFHPDTAPSFTVSPDKGIFHCFGCGAGGNVFSFLMQHQRLSFPEAVQELARRYGITITMKDLGPEGGRQAKKRQLMQEINKEAAAFYQTCLAGAKGEKGRAYIKKRGLTKEVIRDFHIGYAPEEWDALRKHLQNKGISLDAAQEVGLLVPRTQGGYYDRFRDRLMFPILDRQERVIAFGGRIIGTAEGAKYLNSPETPLYSKGRTLYGLPQAQEALRLTGVALVVEGYMDLLALRVHGVANVVATLGTALTKEQVRLLKNQVAKAVLVFDGDVAGARAMRRAFPIFASEGLAVRVLPLPAGLDPDTYAFQHGVELFQSPWDKAQPWFAFLVEELIKAHGLDVEGRVRIAEELRPYFQALSDQVEQGLWLHFAGERLGVDEAALRRSLSSAAPVAAKGLDSGQARLINEEERLLRWVLHHPDIVPLEELEEWARDFENQELKCLLELVISSLKEDGALDHSLLIQRVEEEHLRQQICALTLGKGEPFTEHLAAEWRRDRQMRRLKKALAHIKEELAKAAAVTGGEDLLALQVQKLEIEQQLQELKFF